MKGPSGIVAAGFLILLEYAAALLMKDAFGNQTVYRIARLKGRIQLNQRIGPEQPGFQPLLNPLIDLPVSNVYEASDVRLVVIDQLPTNFESVHRVSLADVISRASSGGSTHTGC